MRKRIMKWCIAEKFMPKDKCVCPICNGSGKFQLPRKIQIDSAEIKKQMAIKLREKGYSIRQIQVALGYKSPRSISIILKK